MKKLLAGLATIFLFIVMVGTASAVTFTPHFDNYPAYVPSQDDLDAAASTWFNTNYGITFDHMYMYTDGRDTFDGLGIANGWVSENYLSNITGTIFFTDTTNFVTIDWWQVYTYPMTISIFNASNVLLGSFNPGGEGQGTTTLVGTGIARLELSGDGGFSAISGLSYNYDGTTDGTNNDTSRVPEPSTLLLLGSGLLGFGFFARKRIKG